MSSKRVSDEERIIAYFNSTPAGTVEVMFRAVKGVLAGRGIETGRAKATKTTTPRKPRGDAGKARDRGKTNRGDDVGKTDGIRL